MHLHLLAWVASRKRIRARPNRSRAASLFLRTRKHASRIRGHCSSVDPVAYIKPEWTLVPGPFLCVMAILAWLQQQAPPRRSWHWGAPKAAWAGHQIVRRTVIKLSNTKVESADGWPAKRGKKHAQVPHPARRVFTARQISRLGRSRGKAVDQFHFLGKITAEIRGRATRTERELNVD